MTDNDTHTVTCACCSATFEGFSPTQAHDCAADVVGDVVVGFYGSTVADMTRLRFAAGRRPEGLADGQICDACITRLKEVDALVVETDSLSPFGGHVFDDEGEAYEEIEGGAPPS